ncbi:MAG: tandem-95 repeat protein, partial [Pedobacter sp.]
TGMWSQISGPTNAVFTNNSLFNSTVANLLGGSYVFRWTITNAAGCSTFSDVTIQINRRPVAVNDIYSTSLNTDVTLPILENDTDPDGTTTIDPGSIVIKTNPANGTALIDPVSGNVIYRPNNGFTGSDSFTYTIKDYTGLESNIAIVTIGISIKPIGSNDAAFTSTNANVVIPIKANDADGANSNIVLGTSPSNGNVVINPDGTVTYTPNTGFSGRDSFTYRLRKSSGNESDPITVTISVKPIGVIDLGNTLAGTPLDVSVKDNDLSAVNTAVIPNASPLNGTLVFSTSGVVQYTPNPGFSGKDTFTYRLRTTDGIESDAITVTINVRPIGTTDNVSTPINLAIPISVKDNDASKTGTSVVIVTT